jgi:hypothetical protein
MNNYVVVFINPGDVFDSSTFVGQVTPQDGGNGMFGADELENIMTGYWDWQGRDENFDELPVDYFIEKASACGWNTVASGSVGRSYVEIIYRL